MAATYAEYIAEVERLMAVRYAATQRQAAEALADLRDAHGGGHALYWNNSPADIARMASDYLDR